MEFWWRTAMGNDLKNQYDPDFVSPPGETLGEIMNARGVSKAQLAERMGCSGKKVTGIIKGEAPITSRMAIELERLLGVSSGFWRNRERHYREFLARNVESGTLIKNKLN